MGFYSYHDKLGSVQYQFSLFQHINDNDNLQYEFASNLPLDLLNSINPNIIKALKSDSEQLMKIETELVELLSIGVRNSKIASYFYYPHWLHVEAKDDDLLMMYKQSSNVTRKDCSAYFAKNKEPMALFALSNQMRNARWFKKVAFQNSFQEISRTLFEKHMNSNVHGLIDTYLDNLNEGKYYFTIKNDNSGVLFFIQVDNDMEPNLIFIK